MPVRVRAARARRTVAALALAALAAAGCRDVHPVSAPQRSSENLPPAAATQAKPSLATPPTTAAAKPAVRVVRHHATTFKAVALRPAQRPPQFIVVSFDGGGSHALWQLWDQVARQSNMHFTAFLTGLYLLDSGHRMQYRGPGHRAGRSSLGGFSSAGRVTTEAADLDQAYANRQEIGTHFMGHFCSDNPPGGRSWSTADWNSELDQFFATLDRYRAGQHQKTAPQLTVPDTEVRGGRTPCLEGRFSQLMPALKAHGLTYDSTFPRAGLSWPVKRAGIWQLGLPVFRLAGTHRPVIAMDYNYWYAQEGARPAASTSQASADGAQVLNTYRDMYAAAFNGNRAPIILGNHFERWNHGVYTAALQTFVRETCQRPETQCVPFRDLVGWLNAQSPKTLARLQSLAAENG